MQKKGDVMVSDFFSDLFVLLSLKIHIANMLFHFLQGGTVLLLQGGYLPPEVAYCGVGGVHFLQRGFLL